MSSVMTGLVRWFATNKSAGFITPDNGGREVFIHFCVHNNIECRKFVEGQRVAFELQTDAMQRLSAINLLAL